MLDERQFIFPLITVGADIRETTPVFRQGDNRCNPSGGSHARIWHWDKTRFTAGPWKQATPPKPSQTTVPKPNQNTVHLFYLSSPSHNLWCDVGDEDKVYCVSAKLPHSVTLTTDGMVKICSGPPCVGNQKLFKPGDPVLAYGQQDEQGRYRCKSETTGISCTVIAAGKGFGKGFLINSAGVRRVGP